MQQQPMTTSEEDLILRVIRIKNWTASGPDMIYAYWLKKLTSLHKMLAGQIEKLVTEGDHPIWLTQGRIVLVMKDPQQSPIYCNYQPNTCLSTTWKLLSGILEDIFKNRMNECNNGVQRGIGGESRELKH